jgi:hypothetical protein
MADPAHACSTAFIDFSADPVMDPLLPMLIHKGGAMIYGLHTRMMQCLALRARHFIA